MPETVRDAAAALIRQLQDHREAGHITRQAALGPWVRDLEEALDRSAEGSKLGMEYINLLQEVNRKQRLALHDIYDETDTALEGVTAEYIENDPHGQRLTRINATAYKALNLEFTGGD